MKSDPFRDHVLDQLSLLGPRLRSRAMFGGHGLFLGETFFGFVWKGQLFFKTTPETAQRYIERGMEPFHPSPKILLKNYYEVPIEVIERRDELLAWANEAVDISGS
jgi:DNA transformation protein